VFSSTRKTRVVPGNRVDVVALREQQAASHKQRGPDAKQDWIVAGVWTRVG
jgi:hypothetical protein